MRKKDVTAISNISEELIEALKEFNSKVNEKQQCSIRIPFPVEGLKVLSEAFVIPKWINLDKDFKGKEWSKKRLRKVIYDLNSMLETQEHEIEDKALQINEYKLMNKNLIDSRILLQQSLDSLKVKTKDKEYVINKYIYTVKKLEDSVVLTSKVREEYVEERAKEISKEGSKNYDSYHLGLFMFLGMVVGYIAASTNLIP